MKPIIGITCGEVKNALELWYPTTYGQPYTYVEAVLRAGGVPVVLPLCRDESVRRQLYELCQGILLAGGNDLNPKLYGEEPVPQTKKVSDYRDEQELQLTGWALADDKPLLAICRGMQLLNVALGGSLHQDIGTMVAGAVDHEVSVRQKDVRYLAHAIHIAKDSRLAGILGVESLHTNSNHHQAVHKLGSGLKEVAWSPDDIIEGIELPQKQFVIGVQSHPEALEDTVVVWQKLFSAFVKATR